MADCLISPLLYYRYQCYTYRVFITGNQFRIGGLFVRDEQSLHHSFVSQLLVSITLCMLTALALLGVNYSLGSPAKADLPGANTIKKLGKNQLIGNKSFEIDNSPTSKAKIEVQDPSMKKTTLHYGNGANNANLKSHLGSPVWHVTIPEHAYYSQAITAFYPSAGKFNGQEFDMKVRYDNFHRYPYWHTKPWIDVSRNAKDGIFYYGFAAGNAYYTFYKHNSSKVIFNLGSGAKSPVYLTFNSLNGLKTGQALALDKITGEWVHFYGSKLGYITRNSDIIRYATKVEQRRGQSGAIEVVGGKPNSPFNDHIGGQATKGMKDFYSHSVSFLADNNQSQMFRFGAGYGSAWFTLSSLTVKNPPEKHHPKPKPTNAEKTVDKTTIHKQNANLTYTIKGKLPERHNTFKYVNESYVDAKGHYHSIVHKIETNTHDNFKFVDNLPKDVTVTSASATGMPTPTVSNNRVATTADKSYMTSHSNQGYVIKIHAIANHLPQPGKNGWSDKGPKKHGWYKFYNRGDVSETIYSQTSSHHTNRVSTKIKRYQGNVIHYDFDHGEAGDFVFLDHVHDNDDFSYHDNYDPNDGVIKVEHIYGYENDRKPVYILKNAYKKNNPQWHYLYGYGNQNTEMIKFTAAGTVQNFYFPYIVPRAKFVNAMIKIDTNKAKDGLPFTLDMRGESFLYREFSDYVGSIMTITVKSQDGTQLYQSSKPLSDILKPTYHGVQWTQWKGKLDTSHIAGTLQKGQKLPVTVHVAITNPKKIQLDVGDTTNTTTNFDVPTNTYGYISSEHLTDQKQFGKDGAANDQTDYIAPQRTIKYAGVAQVRELKEQLKLTQQRSAEAKTGYGMTNDLSLEYSGFLNVQNYLKKGTALNYDFPKQFNEANSNITYPSDPQKHNTHGKQMLADRFDQDNQITTGDSKFSDKLDTIHAMNSDDRQTISEIENEVPTKFNDEKPATFDVNYKFFTRKSMDKSGDVVLADNKDPLAKNNSKAKTDGNDSRVGYNRFYTPYWLKLGSYDTDFSKAKRPSQNAGRLGGNWLNIDELRPVKFYAHMYLAKGTKTQSDDELSLQPIISGSQTPADFTQSEKTWLNQK